MNKHFASFNEKFNELETRERILVFLCLIAVVGFSVQAMVIDPLLKAETKMQRQIKAFQGSIAQQSNQQLIIDAEISAGVNRNKIKRKAQLEETLAAVNEKIEQSIVAMIPPRLMPEVLENILVKDKSTISELKPTISCN